MPPEDRAGELGSAHRARTMPLRRFHPLVGLGSPIQPTTLLGDLAGQPEPRTRLSGRGSATGADHRSIRGRSGSSRSRPRATRPLRLPETASVHPKRPVGRPAHRVRLHRTEQEHQCRRADDREREHEPHGQDSGVSRCWLIGGLPDCHATIRIAQPTRDRAARPTKIGPSSGSLFGSQSRRPYVRAARVRTAAAIAAMRQKIATRQESPRAIESG